MWQVRSCPQSIGRQQQLDSSCNEKKSMSAMVNRLRGREGAFGYCCAGVSSGTLLPCRAFADGLLGRDRNPAILCIGDLISFDNLEYSTANICGSDQRTNTYLTEHESSMCGNWCGHSRLVLLIADERNFRACWPR